MELTLENKLTILVSELIEDFTKTMPDKEWGIVKKYVEVVHKINYNGFLTSTSEKLLRETMIDSQDSQDVILDFLLRLSMKLNMNDIDIASIAKHISNTYSGVFESDLVPNSLYVLLEGNAINDDIDTIMVLLLLLKINIKLFL